MSIEDEPNLFKPEIVITLGGGQEASIRRALWTSSLYNSGKIGRDVPLVLSGGVPRKIRGIQDTMGLSEAEIMYEVISLSCKYPLEIVLDKKARSTADNLINLRRIIGEDFSERKIGNIGIVDGSVHSLRTSRLASQVLESFEVNIYSVPFYSGGGFSEVRRSIVCEGGAVLCEFIRRAQGVKPEGLAVYNSSSEL